MQNAQDGDPLKTALAWHNEGRQVAIVTVTQTWSSAQHDVGTQMVVELDGNSIGSVSGGCIEEKVIKDAQIALQLGQAKDVQYGISDRVASDHGLACGGTIRLLIDPVHSVMPASLLQKLVDCRQASRPVGYRADLSGHDRQVVFPSDHPDRFRLDQSGIEPDGRTFVGILNPPLRLVVIGAVRIAEPLVQMAAACGFETIIVDPRQTDDRHGRFGQAKLITQPVADALDALQLNNRSAVVTLTHDPMIDDPAILKAIEGSGFYIGCLGSKRTHALRLDRLREMGVAAADLDRIRGPVGLDLGGRKAAEIAVSIIAQIIETLRKSH